MKYKGFTFTNDRRKKADEILARYPLPRAAVLPLLWLVQGQEGWVSPEAVSFVADAAGVTKAEVHELVSFYTLFNRRPAAAYHIKVCTGLCCRLRGSDDLLARLKEKLGIDVNGTSADGRFLLSTVECIGSCGTAPVMQINDRDYDAVDLAKFEEVINKLN